jgi:hypothetical protein
MPTTVDVASRKGAELASRKSRVESERDAEDDVGVHRLQKRSTSTRDSYYKSHRTNVSTTCPS